MNNDKDLHSQIDNLFEEMSLDETKNLIQEEIEPTQEEYENELINKLNNNDIVLTEDMVNEIADHIDNGGGLDPKIIEFLRSNLGGNAIAEEVEEAPEYIREELLHPRDFPTTEDKVIQREDYITDLGSQLSKFIKKSDPNRTGNRRDDDITINERIDHLNQQLSILRNAVMESSGRNMVSGIGQGGDGQTPGSGEVRLQKQDDVNMDGIQPGQTLCWDPDLYSGTGGWYPCDGGGGGGTSPLPPINGTDWNRDSTTRMVRSCIVFDEPCKLYWGEEADYLSERVGKTYTDVDIVSIEYVTSIDYVINGDGTYTGNWTATCTAEDGRIITSSVATGTSSPSNGPEGFYALTSSANKIPTCDGTGGEVCTEVDAETHDCTKLDATSPTGQVWWGTETQALTTPHTGAALLSGADNINVVEILSAKTCQEVIDNDGIGEYTVTARQADNTIVLLNYEQLAAIDPLNPYGFFIGSATEQVICDGTVEELDRIEGFQPVCGDPDPDCNACFETDPTDTGYAPLYFGDGITANSVAVRDDGGDLINPVEKIIYTYSEDYVDNNDGTFTGVWNAIVKLRGVTLPVEVSIDNETSGPSGPRGFFINLDDNLPADGEVIGDPAKCLNPLEDGDDNTLGEYKEGIVHSCSETDAEAPLMFGDPAFPSEAVDTGLTGTKVIKVFSLNYREEADNSAYYADWYVLYLDATGSLAAGSYEVTAGAPVPTNDGFYLDTSDAAVNCIEDPNEDLGERIRFGYSPGCTAIVDEGVDVPVYWGAGDDLTVDTNTGETANKIVAIVSLDAGKDHVGTWNAICLKADGSVIVVTYPLDGTTARSPFDGFYLDTTGQVCNDDEEIPGGGEGPTLYPVPEGSENCSLTNKGTEIHWVTLDESDAIISRTQATAGNVIIDDAIEIVKRVFIGYDQYGDCGEFVCLYRKDDGTGNPGTETFITDPVSGCYPESYFTLDLTPVDVTCVDPDPGEIIEGDREVAYGKFTGCRETSQPSDLYWGQPGDNGAPVATDAIKILEIISFNSNDEGYGDWICLYVEKVGGTSTVKSFTQFGQSPEDGFYLDETYCINSNPPILRPAVSLGYIAGCPKFIDANGVVQEADLMWDDGEGNITDTGNDVKILLLTFATEKVLPGTDTNWYALSVGVDDKTVVHGPQGPSESPPSGYLLKAQNVVAHVCAYDPDNIPQPGAEDGPFELLPVGCSQTADETNLRWGTQEDALNELGDDVIDTGGNPILATNIDRTFVLNRFENGYGDYYCVYRNTDSGDGTQQLVKRFDQTPVNSIDHGFFLDLDGTACILGPDATHEPVQGLIHDCREVSGFGELHWGEAEQFINGGTIATYTGIDNVRLIHNVTSIDSDQQGYGNWIINYELADGTLGAYKTYGRSGLFGPEGAFIVPEGDSFCITAGQNRITTREVILVNNTPLEKTGYDLDVPTKEVVHQEEANILFTSSISKLNVIKPNVYMTENEEQAELETQLPLIAVRDPQLPTEVVKTVLAPMQGDLWVVTDKMLMFVWQAEGTKDAAGLEQPELGEWLPIAGAGGGQNTTKDVILINTIRLAEFYLALASGDPDNFELDLETLEKFLEDFPLSTQEDANLLNIELLKEINKRKPTIHVVPDIHAVKNYRPMVGDLWVNPMNYRMYVCNFNKDRAEGIGGIEPRWYHWIEVGGGGGEGGGNNIFLQPDAPSIANRADLWIDENTYYVYVWEGSAWVALTGDLSAVTKEFKVHMAPEPPIDPEVGKLWYDTEMSEMRIYYDNKEAGQSKVWVPVFNPGLDRTKIPQDIRVQELENQLFEVSRRLQILEASRTNVNFTPDDLVSRDPSSDPSGINPYQQ
jgi:hypothetical protein